MVIDFGFEPDGARARALDGRMHRELGDSLAHVVQASVGQIAFDADGLDRVIATLRQGRSHAPTLFADYYDLVLAIDAEDRDQAEQLFSRIAAAEPVASGLSVLPLGSPELGADSDRYRRMMNADPSVDVGFDPPSEQIFQAFTGRLRSGLALAELALPELAAEIRGILRQIVIAASDPSKKFQFDGGSHFQLWGALFLNGQFHPDPLAVVEVLAHESAHSLLFGFCTEEALVENEDEELYASPLRPDPRPMDGIYHATFVSARMHWAMSHLARDERLSGDQRQRAAAAAHADLDNFHAGYGVIATHGRLTELGAQLMCGAKIHIDAAA